MNVDAVKKCIGDLYHTSLKKGLHGHDKIAILEKDWEVNEVDFTHFLFLFPTQLCITSRSNKHAK